MAEPTHDHAAIVAPYICRPITDREDRLARAIIGYLLAEGADEAEGEAAIVIAVAIYAAHRRAVRDPGAIQRIAEAASAMVATGAVQVTDPITMARRKMAAEDQVP